MISILLDAAHAATPNGDVGTAASTTTDAKLATGTLRACLRLLESCCGLNLSEG